MWSAELHLVTLLDEYVGPKPMVADYVRKQLLREQEENSIRQAIQNRQEGLDDIHSPYDCWLVYSGINFSDNGAKLADTIASGDLLHTLFDLTLGQSVKTNMLSHYTEFHQARCTIRSFFIRFSEDISPEANLDTLWWDMAYVPQTPKKRWVSASLKSHSAFLSVLESWLSDSNDLQAWLDGCEAEGRLVNNPNDPDRVFSELAATEVLRSVKVGRLKHAGLNWASDTPSSQLRGCALDQTRRMKFDNNPAWFIEECESLGLFTTRMPRFLQLFFYKFSDWEILIELGQPTTSSSSRRAAEAYLLSGNRPQSACGISDVWYHYVENNQDLYNHGMTQPLPIHQQPPHPRPHSDRHHERYLWSILEWAKMHSRPQPRKKKPIRDKSSSIPVSSSPGGGFISDIDPDDFSSGVMSGTPTPPLQKTEEIPEYTDIGENGLGGGFLDEEIEEMGGQDVAEGGGGFLDEEIEEMWGQDVAEGGGAGMQVVGSMVKVESPEYRFEDDYPETTSFNEALGRSLDEMESLHAVADAVVPTSVSAERELHRSPVLMSPADSSNRATAGMQAEDPTVGDQMDGIEMSQEDQAHTSDFESSFIEAIDTQDVGYAMDGK